MYTMVEVIFLRSTYNLVSVHSEEGICFHISSPKIIKKQTTSPQSVCFR